MRVRTGKKIGGVYISTGTNVSGKGCLTILLSPFSLIFGLYYYLLVWPVKKLIGLFKNGSSKAIKDPAFVRQLQIFDDSIKLMMTTENPETFFGRYGDAERAAKAMSEFTSKKAVHGEAPQDAVEMLKHDKTEVTNAFLDRYAAKVRTSAYNLTRGRKQKLESFMLITSEYDDKMTEESKAHRDKLYQDMLMKLENIEK